MNDKLNRPMQYNPILLSENREHTACVVVVFWHVWWKHPLVASIIFFCVEWGPLPWELRTASPCCGMRTCRPWPRPAAWPRPRWGRLSRPSWPSTRTAGSTRSSSGGWCRKPCQRKTQSRWRITSSGNYGASLYWHDDFMLLFVECTTLMAMERLSLRNSWFCST